jgi:hypothetical protein
MRSALWRESEQTSEIKPIVSYSEEVWPQMSLCLLRREIFTTDYHLIFRYPLCHFPVTGHCIDYVQKLATRLGDCWLAAKLEALDCRVAAVLLYSLHRVHRVVTAAFWRTFHHEGKISPGWWGWRGGHLPLPVKLQCTLQLSGQIHWPCFISSKNMYSVIHSNQYMYMYSTCWHDHVFPPCKTLHCTVYNVE